MREVVKTSLFRMLFPRIPSAREVEVRRKDTAKMVVGIVGDEFWMKTGRYITAGDMEEKRRRLGIPVLSEEEYPSGPIDIGAENGGVLIEEVRGKVGGDYLRIAPSEKVSKLQAVRQKISGLVRK